MPEPTHFLNVDLDLAGPESLTPLLEAWEDEVVVLYHSDVPGKESSAGLEVVAMTKTAQQTIRRFVWLVQRLSPPLRARWDRLTERTFDIGIQSGTAGPHYWRLALSPKTVMEVQQIGASIACTVYSPYDEGPDREHRPPSPPTHRAIKRTKKSR